MGDEAWQPVGPNLNRTVWLNPMMDDYRPDGAVRADKEIIIPCTPWGYHPRPNLVASRLYGTDDWHSPVLDVDFPVRLVPSSTPGHFHLYFDGVMMAWAKYEKLLKALAEAGIIETGYYENAIRRGMTMVRLPHVKKDEETLDWVRAPRSWPEEVRSTTDDE